MVMCISPRSCVCTWEFILFSNFAKLKFLDDLKNSYQGQSFKYKFLNPHKIHMLLTFVLSFVRIRWPWWGLSLRFDQEHTHTLHKIKCQILILRFAHPYPSHHIHPSKKKYSMYLLRTLHLQEEGIAMKWKKNNQKMPLQRSWCHMYINAQSCTFDVDVKNKKTLPKMGMPMKRSYPK